MLARGFRWEERENEAFDGNLASVNPVVDLPWSLLYLSGEQEIEAVVIRLYSGCCDIVERFIISNLFIFPGDACVVCYGSDLVPLE